MVLGKIVGIALGTLLMSQMVQVVSPTYKTVLVVTGSLIILTCITPALLATLDTAFMLADLATLGSVEVKIVMKILGIAYLTEFSSSLCKDAGETALAKAVECAGIFSMFLVANSIIRALIDLILHVLNVS